MSMTAFTQGNTSVFMYRAQLTHPRRARDGRRDAPNNLRFEPAGHARRQHPDHDIRQRTQQLRVDVRRSGGGALWT